VAVGFGIQVLIESIARLGGWHVGYMAATLNPGTSYLCPKKQGQTETVSAGKQYSQKSKEIPTK
jgi:hypothetical protein